MKHYINLFLSWHKILLKMPLAARRYMLAIDLASFNRLPLKYAFLDLENGMNDVSRLQKYGIVIDRSFENGDNPELAYIEAVEKASKDATGDYRASI